MNAVTLAKSDSAARVDAWLSAEVAADILTPAYVFDPAIVVARHAALKNALGTGVVVSVKANPNIDMYVRSAQTFTDGVELASLGELNLVVGRAAVPRYVTSPALDRKFMAAAIASRATILLDDIHQVALAEAAVGTEKGPTRFGLRINAASLDKGTRVDHFGMTPADALDAARRLVAVGSPPVGMHVHSGSHSFSEQSIALAQQAACYFEELDRVSGGKLEFLNLGGGFSEDWIEDDTFTAYVDSIRKLNGRTNLLHEAGRAIYADCGAFMVSVISIKTLNETAYVVCDGGIAHAFLLAQTERFVKKLAQPRLVRRSAAPAASGVRIVKLVGNSCNRADVIGTLPAEQLPAPGDLLIFDRCGAYHTYSPIGFLNLQQAGRFIIA